MHEIESSLEQIFDHMREGGAYLGGKMTNSFLGEYSELKQKQHRSSLVSFLNSARDILPLIGHFCGQTFTVIGLSSTVLLHSLFSFNPVLSSVNKSPGKVNYRCFLPMRVPSTDHLLML